MKKSISQEMAAAGPDFLRFEIPVGRDLCDWVAGHQRWGTWWRNHETIVRRIYYGRRWKRSSIWAIRWCDWRARLIGGFSIGALPASARPVRANLACRPGWWRGGSS